VIRIGLCFALLLSLAMAAWASAQNVPDVASARRLFLEIESAVRLPRAQQSTRLPRLYHDVCRQLNDMYAAHAMAVLGIATNAGETPAQAADRFERSGGWPSLGEAGRQRCKQLMMEHRDAVEALIREGLRAAPRREHLWALFMIGELRAVRLFDDTISALRDPDPIYAAQALRALDDPRAIPPLIQRFREEPTRFFETLRSLQRARPAHRQLLNLLRADDAKVRWQAAYALVESRDPVLVSVIPGLVADPAIEVRRQAGYIGVSFDDAGYRRAQPLLVPLLSDADVGVRADVAVAMASRMDRVSAPALLALVTEEEMLEPWRQSNVVQAINTLTGTYFGLTPGTPSPARRAKAVTDFGQWIKEHPPEERTIR
jgi:hypothetical protein